MGNGRTGGGGMGRGNGSVSCDALMGWIGGVGDRFMPAHFAELRSVRRARNEESTQAQPQPPPEPKPNTIHTPTASRPVLKCGRVVELRHLVIRGQGLRSRFAVNPSEALSCSMSRSINLVLHVLRGLPKLTPPKPQAAPNIRGTLGTNQNQHESEDEYNLTCAEIEISQCQSSSTHAHTQYAPGQCRAPAVSPRRGQRKPWRLIHQLPFNLFERFTLGFRQLELDEGKPGDANRRIQPEGSG